jgi:hypothetical protein
MASQAQPIPGAQSQSHAFGGDFRSTNLDLVLATAIALGLPPTCAWLWRVTGGAAAALVLYYLVCCVLIVRWRKGTLDYHKPARWPWPLLAVSLLPPLVLAILNWRTLPNYAASVAGLLLTALVWAPLNAAMEQLSWFYVLDAWRNRWTAGWLRWAGLAIGVVLMLAMVALIHALFWIEFLPTADPNPWSWVLIPANMALTLCYVLLYYRSRSMWPTYAIHFLTDLQLVLIANYSIVPYL